MAIIVFINRFLISPSSPSFQASGGFVYSFMGLLDKAVAGLAVLFIQEYYPESPPEGYVINSNSCIT